MRTHSAELEQAYRQARYRVRLPDGVLLLAIGALPARERLRLQRATRMQRRWIFLTPCNPASRRVSRAENRQRLDALRRLVRAHRWRHFTAAGVDPRGRWPEEPGFLLIDAPLAETRRLGLRFGQNAIVTGTPRGDAKLIWL